MFTMTVHFRRKYVENNRFSIGFGVSGKRN